MKNSKLVMTVAAFALLSGGVAAAFAQDAVPEAAPHVHRPVGYRPLTVGRHTIHPAAAVVAAPVAATAGVVGGLGNAIATPFNSLEAVGGPIGAVGGTVGGTVGGVVDLAVSPLGAIAGGPVGISNDAAPPLPIKARYAGTGAVANTVDEGYLQEVPVDKSGPIYMLDNGGHDRVVTPFTLAAAPVAGALSIATSPFRPNHAVPHN